MVKFDTKWEITNTYENLQIVWSQFFTDKLIFIYIWSNFNISWFISIWICCQWIQTKSSLFTFDSIRNIRSPIWQAIMKVILPLLCLNPNGCTGREKMAKDAFWLQCQLKAWLCMSVNCLATQFQLKIFLFLQLASSNVIGI